MSFTNIKSIVDAEIAGKTRYTTWRKAPTLTTAAGFWFDLSMSPGYPSPQYYAATPLNTIAMAQSTDGGLWHGQNVSPEYKYIRRITSLTTTNTVASCPMMLLDYLMFYPFFDEGTTDIQYTTNTGNVTLPRYSTGVGVKIMAVSQAAQAGGATFVVSYTNQNGVPGRTTPSIKLGTQGVAGTICTSAAATVDCLSPFIPLQWGDTGVRSIESLTFATTDIGLLALVLVKPICQMSMRGVDAPVEIEFPRDFPYLPKIIDDAYLNFILSPNGTVASANIFGDISYVWG